MTSRPAADAAAVIAFRDAEEFAVWLDTHVDLQVGVWLKLAKQGSGVRTLTADEAVDIGLCYGWISGQRKPCDEVYYLQKYVPRRPHGRWSQVNVAKVEALTASGRMRAGTVSPGPPPVRHPTRRNNDARPTTASAVHPRDCRKEGPGRRGRLEQPRS